MISCSLYHLHLFILNLYFFVISSCPSSWINLNFCIPLWFIHHSPQKPNFVYFKSNYFRPSPPTSSSNTPCNDLWWQPQVPHTKCHQFHTTISAGEMIWWEVDIFLYFELHCGRQTTFSTYLFSRSAFFFSIGMSREISYRDLWWGVRLYFWNALFIKKM